MTRDLQKLTQSVHPFHQSRDIVLNSYNDRTKPFRSHTTLLWRCRFVSHHHPHHNPINRDLADELLTASKQEPFPRARTTLYVLEQQILNAQKRSLPKGRHAWKYLQHRHVSSVPGNDVDVGRSAGGGGGGGDPQLSCLQRLSTPSSAC